jgi:hypothetical protein
MLTPGRFCTQCDRTRLHIECNQGTPEFAMTWYVLAIQCRNTYTNISTNKHVSTDNPKDPTTNMNTKTHKQHVPAHTHKHMCTHMSMHKHIGNMYPCTHTHGHTHTHAHTYIRVHSACTSIYICTLARNRIDKTRLSCPNAYTCPNSCNYKCCGFVLRHLLRNT